MSIPHSRPPQAAADNFANTYEKVLDDVKHEGLIYLSICPGLDKRPMNISLHDSLLRILEANHRPDIEELHCLQKEISYRMHHTYVATAYKNLLGLEFADCHLVSVENHPKNLYGTWISSFLSLRDSSLFDRPQGPGRRYMKGEQYLATCIVEAGWDWLEGVKRLDDLLLYKETHSLDSFVSKIETTTRESYVQRQIISSSDGKTGENEEMNILNVVPSFPFQRD